MGQWKPDYGYGIVSVTTMAWENNEASGKDIVDTAVSAGNFSTRIEAVKVTDLVETLHCRRPFTVFEPTD